MRCQAVLLIQGGWNLAAVAALVAGVLPNIPGFLVSAGLMEATHPLFTQLFSFAWFVGFGIAGAVYYICMRAMGRCIATQPAAAVAL